MQEHKSASNSELFVPQTTGAQSERVLSWPVEQTSFSDERNGSIIHCCRKPEYKCNIQVLYEDNTPSGVNFPDDFLHNERGYLYTQSKWWLCEEPMEIFAYIVGIV